jgi:hypothetical protein
MQRGLFFLLLSIAPLWAGPIGNPTAAALLEEGFWIPDTSWSNVQAGFLEDCLLQKKLRTQEGSPNSSIRKARLSGNSQTGEFAWAIKERAYFEFEAGSGRLSWKWEQDSGLIQGQSDSGFAGSAGAKALLWEIKDTWFAAVGQIGGWRGMQGHVQLNGVPIKGDAKLTFFYWQAGAALAQRIGLFTPYLGWLVNRSFFRVRQMPLSAAKLEAQVATGPFLGCTLSQGSKWMLNLEWRGVFEEGVSLSGQVRF